MEPSALSRPVRRAQETILLIDSNPDERAYWAQRLKLCSSRYHVLEAATAKTGLEIYQQTQTIDGVVLELDLSDSSGFVVLVRLVPRVAKPEVPLVILTRLLSPHLRELALGSGAHAVLFKQRASGDDLDRAIRKAIAMVGRKKCEER